MKNNRLDVLSAFLFIMSLLAFGLIAIIPQHITALLAISYGMLLLVFLSALVDGLSK